MASALENRRGILAMLAAMTCFIGNDTLLKLASAQLGPGEIMAVRGAFASALALGLVLASRAQGHLPNLFSPRVLLRAGVEASVAFLFITSLAHLPLANITAILQAAPLIMTLMVVVLGIEQVGWRRWAAIAVGFLGVLLIVKPDPAAFNLYAGLALLSAVLVAVRDLVTRSIGAEVPSIIVTLSTTLAVGLVGAGLATVEGWRAIDGTRLLLLVAAAVFVTLGNLTIILAFRRADVAVVSPFRYVVILLSIVLGWLVFGELPDPASWLGIALIGGSGIYTIHRERVRRRAAEAAGEFA
ncbi:MAG TPA: DMT family transporter [Beijerinckiaceae bacterium]